MALSPTHAALGRAVRARREELGLTLVALATDAGITKRSVIAIEAGGQNASLGSLLGLAGALGVPLSELLSRAEADVE